MSHTDQQTGDWKQKLKQEMIEYWAMVLYMCLFFGVFVTYKRLILFHHQIVYMDYGISLIKSLILAKVVLLGSLLKLDRGFENKPLIIPTLLKSFTFTVWLLLFSILEAGVVGWFKGEGMAAGVEEFFGKGRYELLGNILVVFSAFIPFFAFKELGRVIGRNKVHELFFRKRTSLDSGSSGE